MIAEIIRREDDNLLLKKKHSQINTKRIVLLKKNIIDNLISVFCTYLKEYHPECSKSKIIVIALDPNNTSVRAIRLYKVQQ